MEGGEFVPGRETGQGQFEREAQLPTMLSSLEGSPPSSQPGGALFTNVRGSSFSGAHVVHPLWMRGECPLPEHGSDYGTKRGHLVGVQTAQLAQHEAGLDGGKERLDHRRLE